MKHSYFRQLGLRVHALPESKLTDQHLCLVGSFLFLAISYWTVSITGVSIFTLKEVQLQRDPGYRNSSYPESGESPFGCFGASPWWNKKINMDLKQLYDWLGLKSLHKNSCKALKNIIRLFRFLNATGSSAEMLLSKSFWEEPPSCQPFFLWCFIAKLFSIVLNVCFITASQMFVRPNWFSKNFAPTRAESW